MNAYSQCAKAREESSEDAAKGFEREQGVRVLSCGSGCL